MANLPRRPWSRGLLLDMEGLGADSLELMTIATTLAECLHMRESGLEDLLLAYRSFGEWCETARRSLEYRDQAIGFFTSGSTGRASLHSHDLLDLEREAESIAALIGPCQRVLSFVPAHHLYGFVFTVLLPNVLRREVEFAVVDMRDKSPSSIAKQLTCGDLIVATPALWALIERGLKAVPANVVGSTSTAPCSPELAAALIKPGALTRLIHLYGSTETSGVAWRFDTSSTYTLFPFCQKTGVNKIERSGRSIELPDHVQWFDETRFVLGGRVDQVVQVGGVNVSVEHVCAKLALMPHVREVVVRRMNPTEGERLKAFVVPIDPKADTVALRGRLTAWIDQNLPFAERPRALQFGASLPRNAMGKLSDWEIASAMAPIS